MLVIVHDGDRHGFFKSLLYIETFRSLYVLEVDAAKSWFQRPDDFDKLHRIFFIDLNIEYIDIGKDLKKHTLSFHDRFTGFRSNVAKAQHCGPVTDYADEISFGCIFINVFLVGCYFLAWLSHTR